MTNWRTIATGSLVLLLSVIGTASADRLNIWRPVDIEQLRESYTRAGIEFPEDLIRKRDQKAREKLADLRIRLAPATPGEDRLGMYYFEGRILKLLPALDRAAPNNSDNHWPKIIFEAYGPGGTAKSRETVVINTRWIRFNSGNTVLDTVADLSRLLSNRHELMGVPFGSRHHRQALFSVLDPDGSMGLSNGPGGETPAGLKEGALMVFAKQGVPSDIMVRMALIETNPIDPILLFNKHARHNLPYSLIEEYARSRQYPAAYEPAYGEMVKATLQIFYTLTLVVPELTSPQYQSQAKHYNVVGDSTYHALSDMLGYRISGGYEYSGDVDSFLPVTGDDVRRAALDVLADGPVVPSPVIKKDFVGSVGLIRALIQVIEKDQTLAPAAMKILERHIAPEPGENPEITALYELDREQNRISGWGYVSGGVGNDDPVSPAVYAFARIGWGEGKEIEEIIGLLLYGATRPNDHPSQHSIDLMRLIAQPEKYTRKDRQKYSNAAAAELDRKIEEIRLHKKKGFSSVGESNFLKIWDAGDD